MSQTSQTAARTPAGQTVVAPKPEAPNFGEPARGAELLEEWEDLLVLLVDPESPKVTQDRARKRRMLSFLLERAGIDETRFWKLARGQRGRLFLSRYSRQSRDLPQLELTSFDLDKLSKERFRHEPLTLGAAWHFGFWRAYFSHAAITHPANDGLREEFSTAWVVARREPAVLFRTKDGIELEHVRQLRLDLPMIVGPLPHSDGHTLERAYLRAIERADPDLDIKTRSLVVVEGERLLAHAEAYRPHAPHVMPRLSAEQVEALDDELASLAEFLAHTRMLEIVWSPAFNEQVRRLKTRFPEHLFSTILMRGAFGDDEAGFWEALENAVRTDGVAMVQVHSGSEKSYRLIPRVDAFLKKRFLRARIQLVSVGGDTDTQASAATVYESVLLGSNGGAMTDVASIALAPELVDVYHGSDGGPVVRGYAGRDQDELEQQAQNTLSCWQHSILDFLSCMGIDDIHKTSGNEMAITVTEDWIREVDALVTPEFADRNRELNQRRIAAEPPPPDVRERYKVSAILEEVDPDMDEVESAALLAHQSSSWHLMNTNRNLTADFLEIIYRMGAGLMPTADDFFAAGDMGLNSIDEVGLRLSKESLAWSIERLQRDPALLDYIQLAVPRGFERTGAAPARSEVELRVAESANAAGGEAGGERVLASFEADPEGGFEVPIPASVELPTPLAGLKLVHRIKAPDGQDHIGETALVTEGHQAHGESIVAASIDGSAVLKRDPRGGHLLSGLGIRQPIWHGPVGHASISLGAASEDFLTARIEGAAGLAFTSSGEGGPLRLERDEDMAWESLQAASGHFGIQAADLRRVRDVEIKINQGAKPGKGGRLSGAKVTEQVSRARNIPVGTNALSPDPKHDIYSIEDMPAEVWLWLLYHNHCGIKITGSNYTKFVAAGMWSNFVVDYLLIDSGLGGSGNYHADSSHVGWPDIFRTILHTHHALVNELVDLEDTGELHPIRDLNGTPFGAKGGTRLFASGGLRGELDMLKVLIAGADGVVEASIGKAVAFGCNQCGNCHLDCPRGGITTKQELTLQNNRDTMRRRFRNWTALNLVKLAVMIDALNYEHGALNEAGEVIDADGLMSDVRQLRGRVDLLEMPEHTKVDELPEKVEADHDSCRVGSLAVSVPVSVHAIWEAARLSHNGGNNRGGGIDFAGFVPAPLREKTCLIFNTIGPDRVDTMRAMLRHFEGCKLYDAAANELGLEDVIARIDEFRTPVRPELGTLADDAVRGKERWRKAGLREDPGDYYTFFVGLRDDVLKSYGEQLIRSKHWLQRSTKYGDFTDGVLRSTLERGPRDTAEGDTAEAKLQSFARLAAFLVDVREEYFSALAHVLDTRYYRTHPEPSEKPIPAGKYAEKRRGYLVSMGEDLGAIKVSGWTHHIPEYFDFDNFWAGFPGADGAVEQIFRVERRRSPALRAHIWGMHHRYPTNSPAIDAEGRGNPAGAHPFKSYNLLLMHNGEQVAVDSTAPFLCEYGYVHAHGTMGTSTGAGAISPGPISASDYEGDSLYERKALTDTEYAAYLVDFTRRVLGLSVEEASQIISPITGIDLNAMDVERREKLRLLMNNYVQLTPTGPYKFTIVESSRRDGERVVGFRENMDIKFLRPHEIISHRDKSANGVEAVANGSEAKIADSMLRILRQQGVLRDAAADLRFSMRQGGKPGLEEHGGVFEAIAIPGQAELTLQNRFGEVVPVKRAGFRVDLSTPLENVARLADGEWMVHVDELVDALGSPASIEAVSDRFGPEDPLPPAAEELIAATLTVAGTVSFHDLRYLTELALPRCAAAGNAQRVLALRVLTELRKRLCFTDLGNKALSSVEYLTDGGRDSEGNPEGGIFRILDAVPTIATGWGRSRHLRISADTRDDLVPPADPVRDVLVLNLWGFESESFTLESCSRFVSECVRAGWRNLVCYDARGGPRYIGTNFVDRDGGSVSDAVIEAYGRETGDFVGALLEGGRIYIYGQGQCHIGFKADSGYMFVLQDALNTCMYAAHGGTISAWDTGSRFAVAGQNKVYEQDGSTLAQGFKSIHFGSPNEYAFEYLMSGGPNSLHVVMGLKKPDARGELALRPKPYAGKFLMSGAAAGRVFLFDPESRMDPAQHGGNVPVEIEPAEWSEQLGPFLADEARRRGAPIRIDGESITVKLQGNWRTWHYSKAFVKLIPEAIANRPAPAAPASGAQASAAEALASAAPASAG